MKIVDLSYEISNESPSYPSDPKIIIKKEKNITNNRSELHSIKIATHSGTHLDAPSHIIKGGPDLSHFSLDSFIGRVVKANKKNYKQLINCDFKFDAIIYDTNWYTKYSDPSIFFGKNRPEIPLDLIEIVHEKNNKFFCCDLPSVDKSGDVNKQIHNLLLSKNIIIYECLTNLHLLPELKPFNFFGLPLSLGKLDGSPTRAIGIL